MAALSGDSFSDHAGRVGWLRRNGRPRALALPLLLLAVATITTAGSTVSDARTPAAAVLRAGVAQPRCFGAASLDPGHPCRNPNLKYSVVPSPMDALITPNAACTLRKEDGPVTVCAFGVEPSVAVATIALVGDSHAADRRAGLEVVAQVKRWHGLSITRSSCSLSTAIPSLPEPTRTQCVRWSDAVVEWFIGHPEVNTVFVGEHARGRVIAPRAHDAFAAKVAGFISVWGELPPSVRHIIVIRDTPQVGPHVLQCVQRAIERREQPGLVCALRRSLVLGRDAAVVAARQLRSKRVQVIDLTSHLCDSLCYPVIGGVLVYKDGDHLTSVFDATLGPFLLAHVRRLLRSGG